MKSLRHSPALQALPWAFARLATLAIGMAFGASAACAPIDEADAAYDREDYARALALYLKLANAGNARAQTQAGLMYDLGRGVAKDPAEAVSWYGKAAAQNDAAGQRNLGSSYARGAGVPVDPKEAAKWYQLAADQNDARAQNALGRMYMDGFGVAKDETRARQYLELALANPMADAGIKERAKQNLVDLQASKGSR